MDDLRIDPDIPCNVRHAILMNVECWAPRSPATSALLMAPPPGLAHLRANYTELLKNLTCSVPAVFAAVLFGR
jgi:hypothetical protein